MSFTWCWTNSMFSTVFGIWGHNTNQRLKKVFVELVFLAFPAGLQEINSNGIYECHLGTRIFHRWHRDPRTHKNGLEVESFEFRSNKRYTTYGCLFGHYFVVWVAQWEKWGGAKFYGKGRKGWKAVKEKFPPFKLAKNKKSGNQGSNAIDPRSSSHVVKSQEDTWRK